MISLEFKFNAGFSYCFVFDFLSFWNCVKSFSSLRKFVFVLHVNNQTTVFYITFENSQKVDSRLINSLNEIVLWSSSMRAHSFSDRVSHRCLRNQSNDFFSDFISTFGCLFYFWSQRLFQWTRDWLCKHFQLN